MSSNPRLPALQILLLRLQHRERACEERLGSIGSWLIRFANSSADEDYYETALEFVPERWYSKPDMIKHKNAFAPFILGSESCIGKNREYSAHLIER